MTVTCPRILGGEVRTARFSVLSGWVHLGGGRALTIMDLYQDVGYPLMTSLWFDLEVVS